MSRLVYYFSGSYALWGFFVSAWSSLFVLLPHCLVFFGSCYSLHLRLIKIHSPSFCFGPLFRSFSYGLVALSGFLVSYFSFSFTTAARSFLDYRPCSFPLLSFACSVLLFSSLSRHVPWTYEAWLPFSLHSELSLPSYSSFYFFFGG